MARASALFLERGPFHFLDGYHSRLLPVLVVAPHTCRMQPFGFLILVVGHPWIARIVGSWSLRRVCPLAFLGMRVESTSSFQVQKRTPLCLPCDCRISAIVHLASSHRLLPPLSSSFMLSFVWMVRSTWSSSLLLLVFTIAMVVVLHLVHWVGKSSQAAASLLVTSTGLDGCRWWWSHCCIHLVHPFDHVARGEEERTSWKRWKCTKMEVEEKTNEVPPPPHEQRECVAQVEAEHPNMQAGESMYLVQSRCVRDGANAGARIGR